MSFTDNLSPKSVLIGAAAAYGAISIFGGSTPAKTKTVSGLGRPGKSRKATGTKKASTKKAGTTKRKATTKRKK